MTVVDFTAIMLRSNFLFWMMVVLGLQSAVVMLEVLSQFEAIRWEGDVPEASAPSVGIGVRWACC